MAKVLARALFLCAFVLGGCEPEDMRTVSTRIDGGGDNGDGDGDGEGGDGDGDGDGDGEGTRFDGMIGEYRYAGIPLVPLALRIRPFSIGQNGEAVVVAEHNEELGINTLYFWHGGSNLELIHIADGYHYVPSNTNRGCLLEDGRLLLNLTTDEVDEFGNFGTGLFPVIISDGEAVEPPRPAPGTYDFCNDRGQFTMTTSKTIYNDQGLEVILTTQWLSNEDELVKVYEQVEEGDPYIIARGINNAGMLALNVGYWTAEDGITMAPVEYEFVMGPTADGRVLAWVPDKRDPEAQLAFVDIKTGEVGEVVDAPLRPDIASEVAEDVLDLSEEGDVLFGPTDRLSVWHDGKLHSLRIPQIVYYDNYGMSADGHVMVWTNDENISGLVFYPPD